MKRPHITIPRRPSGGNPSVARTPKQAAMHLVRLEFDAARLEQGKAQAEDRAAAFGRELRANDAKRAALLTLLNR